MKGNKYLFVFLTVCFFVIKGYTQQVVEDSPSDGTNKVSYSVIAYPLDITQVGEIRSSVLGFEVGLFDEKINVQVQGGPSFRPQEFAKHTNLIWGYSYGTRLSLVTASTSRLKLLPYISYRYTRGSGSLNIFEEDLTLRISRSMLTNVVARQRRYMAGGTVRLGLNSFIAMDVGLGFGFLVSRVDSPRALFGPSLASLQFIETRAYNQWHQFLMIDGFLGVRFSL